MYQMNEELGTAEELKELIQARHDRDIWMMVDVVVNQIGYVENFDYSSIVPFNNESYYNPYVDCATVDPPSNGSSFEIFWLSGLPDFDQSNPFVRETLMSWISDLVQTYNFDALRIDTIPHVPRDFWAEFSKASGVFCVSEVLNIDLHYLATYQGPLESILNYTLYDALRSSFQQGKPMTGIQDYYHDAIVTWPDITVLGNFINNHDNPSFLSNSTNVEAFKVSLAFTMASVGIPMVYYGDEQAFSVIMDPANREPLWTDMKADSDIYGFLRTINTFRRESKFYNYDQVERLVDESFYSFTRGRYFFAFTNSLKSELRAVSSHFYPEETLLCSIFDNNDCMKVQHGEFSLVLHNGEVKILAPKMSTEEEVGAKKHFTIANGVKDAVATASVVA